MKKIIFFLSFIAICLNAAVYEDAEDGLTAGWSVYDNDPAGAGIENAYDDERQSRVIQLNGTGSDNGFVLRDENNENWNDNEGSIFKWSSNFNDYFVVYAAINVNDQANARRYIYYFPGSGDVRVNGQYIGIPVSSNDGAWKTYERDLEADLASSGIGKVLVSVDAVAVRGNGRMDDIELNVKEEPPQDGDIIYEDGEDGTTLGWSVYDNDPAGATITNVYDEDKKSRVIELIGTGRDNGFVLQKADGQDWENNNSTIIEWSHKIDNVESYQDFQINVKVTVNDAENPIRYLYYMPGNTSWNPSDHGTWIGFYIHHDNGLWTYTKRDLQADLHRVYPDLNITSIENMSIRGSGRFDDIAVILDEVPEPRPSTVYEDAEDGSIDRWFNYQNLSGTAAVHNIDKDGSRRIQLDGTRQDYYYLEMEPDNTDQFILEFDLRGRNYCFMVYAEVDTLRGKRFIEYASFTPGRDEGVHYGIYVLPLNPDGTQIPHDYAIYGYGWNHVRVDLKTDLERVDIGNKMKSVKSFRATGRLYMDNIKLSSE